MGMLTDYDDDIILQKVGNRILRIYGNTCLSQNFRVQLISGMAVISCNVALRDRRSRRGPFGLISDLVR